MDIKHILKQIFWILSASFLCSSSCSKTIGGDCAATVYTFELPFKARPDTDSIQLGEAITFSIEASTVFVDKISGMEVDYNGAGNLGSAVGFIKYDSTAEKWVHAAGQHKYSLAKGIEVRSADTTVYREYLFAESNGRYVFELAITPKSPGLYGVIFSDAANVFRGSDPCTKAAFIITLEGTSHNRYLDGDYNEITPGGDFYFHVSP